MIDDLDRPLGQDQRPPPQPGRGRRWLAPAALALVVAGGGAYFVVGKARGPGADPEAVATIRPAPPPAPPKPNAAAADEVATASQVEVESGVRVFRGSVGVPGPVIIPVTDAGGASPLPPAPDRRLVEKSRFGPLPRRVKDGATPAQVYARPLSLQSPIRPGTPRVAILVGGMGLDVAATDSAVHSLPADVSLAFAPYGAELERQTAAARDAGHEILLQAPMDPFNSSDSPGPHVLRVSDGTKALDDLHWQMGRFVGYVGLVNFLGGRFTADQAATQLLMRELADRGLDYVDDGSSPQSLAGAVATASGVGFAKADLRIDASRNPESIDAALFRLETLARQNGVAVGFAAGLPEASERIARFVAELKHRGVALIPVSAAVRLQALAAADKR